MEKRFYLKSVSIFLGLVVIIAVGLSGCTEGSDAPPIEVTPDQACTDGDSDNYYAESGCGTEVDCDDSDSAINPGTAEICDDNKDNDCDGATDCVDTDCPACQTCTDGDIDYYFAETGCGTEVDCDDGDSSINPGATEICDDNKDNDCDGATDCVDTDCPACQTCTDDDSDDYFAETGCGTNVDCNDGDSSINPGATEILSDGKDNDCDGKVDEQPSPANFTNSFDMTFNLLSADTFIMGSPEDELGRYSNREIQHEVTLTQDFYMQTTEVTQGQWETIITAAEGAGFLTSGDLNQTPSFFSSCGSDCPVQSVSWDDIQIFISALNQFGEGTYSLPTEAQWEYAARAGSTTAFSNGPLTETGWELDPNLDAMGWYVYNSGSVTHPVAQKDANAWGLYDMHGNVWEWCQDWYQSDLGSDPVTDPEGPGSSSSRVIRGGRWGSYSRDCRSAVRQYRGPDTRGSLNGFRLALLPGQ